MPEEPLLILIVDDSPEDRELYRRCLNSRSGRIYQFFEADSAQKGLAMCRLWPINCILLDYRLPDVRGFELLEAAFEARLPGLLHATANPVLAPLQGDPRFEDLRRRIGLPAQLSSD